MPHNQKIPQSLQRFNWLDSTLLKFKKVSKTASYVYDFLSSLHLSLFACRDYCHYSYWKLLTILNRKVNLDPFNQETSLEQHIHFQDILSSQKMIGWSVKPKNKIGT